MPRPWPEYGIERGIPTATLQRYVEDAIGAATERGASTEFVGAWDPMSVAARSDLLGWHSGSLRAEGAGVTVHVTERTDEGHRVRITR
ncbi:hypothetical protein [Streptomyces sp. GSL17-111]|uniref:hypothetical protein n=1 Tax=Streptomyces sp. GSL17-111 TaxID=3121596 RepID=UPI0030F40CAC